jgi:hypothetical protein
MLSPSVSRAGRPLRVLPPQEETVKPFSVTWEGIMKKSAGFALGLLLLCSTAQTYSQTKALSAPLNWTTQQDHQDMQRQLGITQLRRGPSGQANAPNPANYEEAKANPFSDLPALMTLKNGQAVTTLEQWRQRRAEIIEEFDREILGRVPANMPKVTWRVEGVDKTNINRMPVTATRLVGKVDNSAYPAIAVEIQMTMVLPDNAKGPVPLLMMFGRSAYPNPSQPGQADFVKLNNALKAAMLRIDPSLKRVFQDHPGWEAFIAPNPFAQPARNLNENGDPPSQEQLIAAGWGFATIEPGSIQADNGAGLTRGIIGLMNKGQARKPEDWGSLRAWAWGASRGLDYLKTVKAVDGNKVGIEGVSRYGKAALVTMAYDERFHMVLVGSSGEGGAKLHRRNFGEAVETVAGAGEYHWVAGNFLKYATAESKFGAMTPNDMPVDAHQLIALCAPRLTFISYGVPEKGDALWLDQQGSYMATVAAQPAWQLHGAKALGVSNDWRSEKKPAVEVGLLDGKLAWRQHNGGHTSWHNMKHFIAWADREMGRKPTQTAAN